MLESKRKRERVGEDDSTRAREKDIMKRLKYSIFI